MILCLIKTFAFYYLVSIPTVLYQNFSILPLAALTKLTTLSITGSFNFTFEKLGREYHPLCRFGDSCYPAILSTSDLLGAEMLTSPDTCLTPHSFSTDLSELNE